MVTAYDLSILWLLMESGFFIIKRLKIQFMLWVPPVSMVS